MKNKDVENIVKRALDAHRVQDVTEIQIKNLEICLDSKDKEIWEHQKAIDNLREYITFLEGKICKLKHQLDEHNNF